jgi:DNA-binding transcriptional MerR regulator
MHTIEDTARRSGLSVHTLRYYEKAGILPKVGRNGGGHRRYSDNDLGWIGFVKMLKATGMALRDIRAFVAAEQRGKAGYAEKLRLLGAHKALMSSKIAEMQTLLERLDQKIAYYEARQ